MNQPKLKDSVYGEMFWEDESEWWFARVEDKRHGGFEIMIHCESPLNFFAVRNTHSTFRKLLDEIPSIKRKSVRELFENEEVRFQKARHKSQAAEMVEQKLELFSITIYEDLSAEVVFDSEMFDDTDEFVFAHVDENGDLLEAAIATF